MLFYFNYQIQKMFVLSKSLQIQIFYQQITNYLSKYMYNQRPNIDLNSMLDKGSALSRPRAPTPIRKAPIKPNNKENLINTGNQWNNIASKNNMTYQQKDVFIQQNAIKKPLISPVRNPFKAQIQHIYEQQRRVNKQMGNTLTRQKSTNAVNSCANHPNKQAQFNIEIDQQLLAYCGRCAAQLASQGFQVCKIDPATIKKGDNRAYLQQNQRFTELPRYPQYQGNQKYQLILQFLSQLFLVQNEHLQNMKKLTMIDNNYAEQIQQTKQFYSQLLSFVEQMKNDHLNDLFQQSRKHSQIADIQHDYLRQNVDEIGNIRRDIQENLQTIVQKLDQQDLRNNLNYYKQKIQVYRHKVQQQSQFFGKIISFSPQQYNSKLGRVQDFLMQVWNTDGQSQMPQVQQQQPERFVQKFIPRQNRQQQQMPKKQLQYLMKAPLNHQQQSNNEKGQPIIPSIQRKSNNVSTEQENKSTAFRKLFQQQQDQIMAETSPQFKKI